MPQSSRTAQAEATRRQLMESARAVFTERGYQGATVKAITQRADTAHGTFYLYFKNKEDAFVEVISEVLDELYQHSFAPIDGGSADWNPHRFRERIAGFLTVAARQGRLWRAIVEGALASPRVERHWMDQRHRFHEAATARTAMLQGAGAFREFDPHVGAVALTSMLEWFAFSSIAFEEPGSLDPTPEVIDTLADLWLHAVGAGGPSADPTST